MFPKVFNVHSGACEQRLTKGIKALNFISFLCICKKYTFCVYVFACVCVCKQKPSKYVKYAFALIF